MRTRRKLLGALDYIITKRQSLNEKYWTIYGSGSIGAKAEELRQKSWAIEKAGFSLIPRAVLAMDFFSAFYERNGITGGKRHF